MTFKAATRPLCRLCGKPVPKVTDRLLFGQSPRDCERFTGYRVARPSNKEAAQRYANGQILAVRYGTMATGAAAPGGGHFNERVPRYVESATYWDGESYRDEHFCSDPCAVRFGYFAAVHARRC
jgi:hypothetical protein